MKAYQECRCEAAFEDVAGPARLDHLARRRLELRASEADACVKGRAIHEQTQRGTEVLHSVTSVSTRERQARPSFECGLAWVARTRSGREVVTHTTSDRMPFKCNLSVIEPASAVVNEA